MLEGARCLYQPPSPFPLWDQVNDGQSLWNSIAPSLGVQAAAQRFWKPPSAGSDTVADGSKKIRNSNELLVSLYYILIVSHIGLILVKSDPPIFLDVFWDVWITSSELWNHRIRNCHESWDSSSRIPWKTRSFKCSFINIDPSQPGFVQTWGPYSIRWSTTYVSNFRGDVRWNPGTLLLANISNLVIYHSSRKV